jgi:hypothetical protein
MSSGWFALFGVVIGGTLNGVVSWVLARGATRTSARAAALLVTEELIQSFAGFATVDARRTWGALCEAHNFGRTTEWAASRTTLALVLSPDAYASVSAASSGLAQAAARAAAEPPESAITLEQNEALRTTVLTLNRALIHLGRLVHRPPVRRFMARRRFDRQSDAHIEKLLTADTKLQAFMAKYARPSA